MSVCVCVEKRTHSPLLIPSPVGLFAFVPQTHSWYDVRTRAKVVDPDLFKRLQASLDTFGLNGLDKLFSFMLVADLQKVNGPNCLYMCARVC